MQRKEQNVLKVKKKTKQHYDIHVLVYLNCEKRGKRDNSCLKKGISAGK